MGKFTKDEILGKPRGKIRKIQKGSRKGKTQKPVSRNEERKKGRERGKKERWKTHTQTLKCRTRHNVFFTVGCFTVPDTVLQIRETRREKKGERGRKGEREREKEEEREKEWNERNDEKMQ